MDLTQQPNRNPVPEKSLALLKQTSFGGTGGSVAARSFLFSLIGEPDPAGIETEGALEIRRLDHRHHQAVLEVFTWWTSGTSSDEPLHDILNALRDRFQPGAAE